MWLFLNVLYVTMQLLIEYYVIIFYIFFLFWGYFSTQNIQLVTALYEDRDDCHNTCA